MTKSAKANIVDEVEEKDIPLFKGYINYYKKSDPEPRPVKSYHFDKKTQEEVDKLEKRFINNDHIYVGTKSVEIPKKD